MVLLFLFTSCDNSLEISVIITIKKAVNVNEAQKHEYRI